MRYRDLISEDVTDPRLQRAIDQGFNLEAFHGTENDFDEFDPRKTGDIGIHFGSPGQASHFALDLRGQPKPGGNIIPVRLKLHRPLRVKDMFSTLRVTFINRAKQWTLATRGFHANEQERAAIYAAAKAADAARRRGGGDWSIQLDKSKASHLASYEQASRAFWEAIQASCERQGYDGLIYDNKAEGGGDSYVVFHANQVRAQHASFDPDKAESSKLLDSAPSRITDGRP